MRRTAKNIMVLSFSLLIWSTFGQAQKPKENSHIEEWINKGLSAYDKADYETAEHAFRKVLTIDPLNAVAAYNLGLTDIELDKKLEAAHFFKKAAQTAAGDNLKSKAFFNQGNIWYQKKKYDKAVEAYKNALRHNPADEEARYNLALAQMKLKKQQKNNRNKKNKQNKNNQNKQNQNKNKNQQNKNKQNKQNQKNKSKQKPKNDQNKKNQDQQNKKEKNKQGKGDHKKKQQNNQNKEQNKQNNKPNKGQQKQPNGGQGQQKQSNRKPVPRKGQLTPQQVKQILVALKNKEQKTQKKIKAKILKGSGRKRKQDKDW